jgi:hypothetical protein
MTRVRKTTETQRHAERKYYFRCLPILLFLLSLLAGCAAHKQSAGPLPPYPDFVSASAQRLPKGIVEIYGRYAATVSGKTGKSGFNLLLDPGKSAYMEILNPASQLTHAVSLNGRELSLLWADDGSYIEEDATSANLNAIAGLPLMPDDLLFLIAGYGLDFNEWQQDSAGSDGWVLSRKPFVARVTLEENLSKIIIRSADHPTLEINYDEYRNVDNQSLPARIRFRVPSRKLTIEISIDKYEPRDEPSTPDLFALKLPENARRLSLHDIYHGKPLLLQR